MGKKQLNNYKAIMNIDAKKLPVLYKSILVGLVVGVATSAYRLLLMDAEQVSFAMYAYLRNHLIFLPLAFLLLGLAGYLVGFLVSKFKMISGSGIPQVKGLLLGYCKNNWFTTFIAKFSGGAVAILAGLSLGREGPSVQIGACVAQGVGNKLASSRTEKKVLIASGAGAGLAAAFNAPLAGTMFAMEEIYKYFSPVILLSTMVAAVVADFIARIAFGANPIFSFNVHSSIPLSGYWLLFILGAALGLAGAGYNYILLQIQALYKKIKWLDGKAKLIIPFIFAGILGIVFPLALCGGHVIIEQLQLSTGITFLLLILAVKFLFSMISFGSGAPGGIFFPLLIIGATIGAIFGNIAVNYFGFDANLFYNFVILAMAGYFTAIVRAPITGVILLVEMTGSFTQLLSLTVVSIVAYVAADVLKSKPIYDSLLENQMADNQMIVNEQDVNKKITIEMVVHHGAAADNKRVREINIPSGCLLIAIQRGMTEMIPRGDTKILAGDYLVFLTNVTKEAQIREMLNKMVTAA